MKIEKLIKNVKPLNFAEMKRILGGNGGNDTDPNDDETNETSDGIIQDDPLSV